jgi:hypothetical protein
MPVLRVHKTSVLRALSRRVFYPDLVRHGGFKQALNAALGEIRSSLRVVPEADWAVEYARVESGRRFSQLYVAAQFRTFLFDCWDRDACLAKGTTWSLMRVAQTVDGG